MKLISISTFLTYKATSATADVMDVTPIRRLRDKRQESQWSDAFAPGPIGRNFTRTLDAGCAVYCNDYTAFLPECKGCPARESCDSYCTPYGCGIKSTIPNASAFEAFNSFDSMQTQVTIPATPNDDANSRRNLQDIGFNLNFITFFNSDECADGCGLELFFERNLTQITFPIQFVLPVPGCKGCEFCDFSGPCDTARCLEPSTCISNSSVCSGCPICKVEWCESYCSPIQCGSVGFCKDCDFCKYPFKPTPHCQPWCSRPICEAGNTEKCSECSFCENIKLCDRTYCSPDLCDYSRCQECEFCDSPAPRCQSWCLPLLCGFEDECDACEICMDN
ncbi:hypothetical protein ACHAWF_014700 [Thalassiosira exigua]